MATNRKKKAELEQAGLLRLAEHEQLNGLLSGDGNGTAGISEIEVMRLAYLGAHLPVGGDVVEIGSHRGKSICCIGAGVRHAGNDTARLFAVDLWTTGQGRTFEHYSSTETWEIFQRQLTEMGLAERVKAVVSPSVEASKRRKRPIHLLFIDASHKYKDVLADFRAWGKFVPAGGVIAFHDYTERFPGVQRVVDEEVIGSGAWGDFEQHDRLFTARRL